MTIQEAIEIIEDNLSLLEILKQYLYFDKKNNLIKMKSIKECETNFDFEIIKEWLQK